MYVIKQPHMVLYQLYVFVVYINFAENNGRDHFYHYTDIILLKTHLVHVINERAFGQCFICSNIL